MSRGRSRAFGAAAVLAVAATASILLTVTARGPSSEPLTATSPTPPPPTVTPTPLKGMGTPPGSVAGPATAGSGLWVGSGLWIKVAGRDIPLPPDVLIVAIAGEVLCIEGLPCPGTPIYVLQRGNSFIWVSKTTGEYGGEEIAPGEEGAFDFLKALDFVSGPLTAASPNLPPRPPLGVTPPPPPPQGSPPPPLSREEALKRLKEMGAEPVTVAGPATAGSWIRIAGQDIKLPPDVYIAGIVMEVLCGWPCPVAPIVILRRGNSTISIQERTGEYYAEKVAPGEEGAFDFLKALDFVKEFPLRTGIRIAGQDIKLPPSVSIEAILNRVRCVEGRPCPPPPIVVLRRGNSFIAISQPTGEYMNDKIAPGEEGAFDFLKEVLSGARP